MPLIRQTDWTTGGFGSASSGAAGSTSGAGDGWIDQAGGIATAGSAALLTLTNPAGNSLTQQQYVIRPSSEAVASGLFVARFRLADGVGDRYIVLRHNGANTNYLLGYSSSQGKLLLYRNVAGTTTLIAQATGVTTPTGSHVLRLAGQVAGVSSVAMSLSLYDETTGAFVAAVSGTDAAPPTALQGPGQSGLINGTASNASSFLSASVSSQPSTLSPGLQFSRFQPLPVIPLGSTYNGTVADALAAPAVCYDPAAARWVMLADAWNVATTMWYNLAFTSPDLVVWTYVVGSKQTPSGGNYIVGNGGIVKNRADGKFYKSYSTYAHGTSPTNGVFVASSSDLINWTAVNGGAAVLTNGTVGSGDSAYLCDSSLAYNPNTGLYELWYCGSDPAYPGRSVMYATSPDCVTWTKQGIQFGSQAWNRLNTGEPCAFYVGATRYVTFDSGPVAGARSVGIASLPPGGSSYSFSSNALIPEADNSWENTNVFDSDCVGAVDRGDGRGQQLYMLYAGSPIVAISDATQSGIGLALAPVSGNDVSTALASVGLTPATPAQTSTSYTAQSVIGTLASGPQQSVTTKFAFGTGDPYEVAYQGVRYPVYAGTSTIPQPIAAILIAQGLAS